MFKKFYKRLLPDLQEEFIRTLSEGTEHCPSVFGLIDYCKDSEGDCKVCYKKALESDV